MGCRRDIIFMAAKLWRDTGIALLPYSERKVGRKPALRYPLVVLGPVCTTPPGCGSYKVVPVAEKSPPSIAVVGTVTVPVMSWRRGGRWKSSKIKSFLGPG